MQVIRKAKRIPWVLHIADIYRAVTQTLLTCNHVQHTRFSFVHLGLCREISSILSWWMLSFSTVPCIAILNLSESKSGLDLAKQGHHRNYTDHCNINCTWTQKWANSCRMCKKKNSNIFLFIFFFNQQSERSNWFGIVIDSTSTFVIAPCLYLIYSSVKRCVQRSETDACVGKRQHSLQIRLLVCSLARYPLTASNMALNISSCSCCSVVFVRARMSLEHREMWCYDRWGGKHSWYPHGVSMC